MIRCLESTSQIESDSVSSKNILMSRRVKTVSLGGLHVNLLHLLHARRNSTKVMICTNLNKREVQNHWYSAAKNGVGTILCRVSHTIMAAVTCYDDSLCDAFHLVQHLLLVGLPKKLNCWK